jgi:hypothetical protein
MKMARARAYPVYEENSLVTRIGVSLVPDPTWAKAILTALAARPTCGARYTDQRKAQLLDLADSVQRRLDAVEELTTQLSKHMEEANRLAGSLWGHPKTVTRLVIASTSLITELWASFDNLAQFCLVFRKHIIRKRISGKAFEAIADFSGDRKAVAALAGWRDAVLHKGALSPVLWGADASGSKQSIFRLSVPTSDNRHVSFDELIRCRQLLAQAIGALASDLIERINRET